MSKQSAQKNEIKNKRDQCMRLITRPVKNHFGEFWELSQFLSLGK